MEGSVYVLTNPAMPNMVKIGKTTRNVELRLEDLYSTGIPLPFGCEYAAKVKDVDKTEKAFHTAFSPNRVKYLDDIYSLTGLTKKLLGEDGTRRRRRGTKWWFYKGKNLVDIYNETYSMD